MDGPPDRQASRRVGEKAGGCVDENVRSRVSKGVTGGWVREEVHGKGVMERLMSGSVSSGVC